MGERKREEGREEVEERGGRRRHFLILYPDTGTCGLQALFHLISHQIYLDLRQRRMKRN